MSRNLTQSSLRSVLIFAQCFGLLPITGITAENCDSLEFKWTSKRTIYSIFILVCATCNTIFFLLKMISDGAMEFTIYVNFLFFFVTALCGIIFIDVARKWPSLMKTWTEVDKAMSTYEYPVHLKRNINIISAIIMGAAIVEHTLFDRVQFISCAKGVNFIEDVDQYMKFRYDFVFDRIPYHIALAIFLEILNLFSTISWNYMDLFIVTISMCLSVRFKQVAKNIEFLATNNVTNVNVWERVRVDYTRLTALCASVDRVTSSLLLVSFGYNVFVILIQIFTTIGLSDRLGILGKTYYIFSFVFLIFRLVVVALYASSVHFESKKPKRYLGAVPKSSYNVEVGRLLDQVTYNPGSLSGHKLFRVTRSTILRISLAIVTYELVLIELNS